MIKQAVEHSYDVFFDVGIVISKCEGFAKESVESFFSHHVCNMLTGKSRSSGAAQRYD